MSRGYRFGWLDDDIVFATKAFDPDQPRDEHGRWSETGAGGGPEPDVLAPITNHVTQSGEDWERMKAKLRPGYDVSSRYPSGVRYRGTLYLAQLHAIAQDMAIRANRKGPEPEDYDAAAARFERDVNAVGAEHIYGLVGDQGSFRSYADMEDPDSAHKAFKSFDPNQPRDEEGKWTATGFSAPNKEFDRYNPDVDISDAIAAVSKAHEDLYQRSIQDAELYDGDQIDAVKRYANEDYAEINQSLRAGRAPNEDYLTERIANMDALFDKASLARDLMTYRRVDDATLNELKQLKSVVDRGFVSTSSSPSAMSGAGDNPVGGDRLVAIQLPKGAKALPIAHLSAAPLEREVLIARGQAFDVVPNGVAALPRDSSVDLVVRVRV